ncbi:single-stranded DNA-binding protein [Pseudomonas protegens]|uniref:Single-stranded DNA-binding protein n=1 Tax=Pseudomonas protegens TaxID=380021 RepID=A0A2T6GB39_9PSED|nr:single-stranded DNA-binding protein [Pseudomonas protegens]PUA41368.1 single-stranded DNA-binding protein [Pseudomonas protegens]
MSTAINNWEGNVGSTPEFKEFPNGNKEPRRLLRLNVYFDNSIPDNNNGYQDKGGFWAHVELWHRDAEHYATLYQKGMRVLISGRAVMDAWEKDGEKFQALKVQASRVALLPHRLTAVSLAPSQNSNTSTQPPAANQPLSPVQDDGGFDDDIPQ